MIKGCSGPLRLPGALALVGSTLGLFSASSLPAADFTRGDVDANGVVLITDPVRTLGFLFLGSPAEIACDDAADANDDGAVNITDPVFMLSFLFLGGPAPPAPFGACGVDPSMDALGCASFPRCEGRLTSVLSTSPANGERDVFLRRETVIRFRGPVDPATVTPEAVRASFGGQSLPARLHLSPDAATLSLFYTGPLPESARACA